MSCTFVHLAKGRVGTSLLRCLWSIQLEPKMGPTHICACIFQILWQSLLIFGTRKRKSSASDSSSLEFVRYINSVIIIKGMTNSTIQKLNNNILYEGTTERNSNDVQQDVSHCQTPSATCRAKRSHIYRACDVASKQSRLEPGRLCSVGSPAAASILRWLFETVETAETGNPGFRSTISEISGHCHGWELNPIPKVTSPTSWLLHHRATQLTSMQQIYGSVSSISANSIPISSEFTLYSLWRINQRCAAVLTGCFQSDSVTS